MKTFAGLCPWLADALARLESAALDGRLGHGWLISGPDGIGKANLAYVLADRLLDDRLGPPAPAPAAPRGILADYAKLAEPLDMHPDLHRVRPEEGKRTIAVEQIRELISALALTPHVAGRKLVIIEAAESMTREAANALLKSLEEPTRETYLLLLATRPGRLPATIRSRCQHLHLRGPRGDATRAWLESDGLAAQHLRAGSTERAPIAAARLVIDEENFNKYIKLYEEIDSFSDGSADPHAMAEAWQKGDTVLALRCLADRLQAAIRERLVPGLTNPVTDDRGGLTDNPHCAIPTDILFAGLQMAENLREQLERGGGINVELALKALLLDLDTPPKQRVTT